MSPKESGERLLTEALTGAMDRDLADIPPMEQLIQQHRFSKKFVRSMRRLGADQSSRWEAAGRMAKRYGGLAAAFVCVIGLVTVAGLMGRSIRMGTSSAEESIMEEAPADAAPPASTSESAAEESQELPEEPASSSGNAGAGESEEFPDKGLPEDELGEQEQPEALAPDWQENLLSESAKADELVTWHLNMIYEDGSIGLSSKVVNPSHQESLYISGVFEVYYEASPDEWECIYRTKRARDNYAGVETWDEWYALEKLHMTQAGTYRLVRQVNSNRQVLQLTLDEK